MNTVSKETMQAEQTIETNWGGLPRKPCIMVQGTPPGSLAGGGTGGRVPAGERDDSVLEGNLPRAALLPGPKTQESNLGGLAGILESRPGRRLKGLPADGWPMHGIQGGCLCPFFPDPGGTPRSPAADSQGTLPLFRHLSSREKERRLGSRGSDFAGPQLSGGELL